ncbi:hypothetical protein, partial [[Eubacterium] cellulosolvens]
MRAGVAEWKKRNQAEDWYYHGEHDFRKTERSWNGSRSLTRGHSEAMRYIDMPSWPRRKHFEVFNAYDHP